jgi:hypothetical protein
VAEKTQQRAPAKANAKSKSKSKKKVWETPRVKSGRLFESNSLACGKNHPDGADCDRSAQMS